MTAIADVPMSSVSIAQVTGHVLGQPWKRQATKNKAIEKLRSALSKKYPLVEAALILNAILSKEDVEGAKAVLDGWKPRTPQETAMGDEAKRASGKAVKKARPVTRTSKFSGMYIYPCVQTNPRRPNSHGYRSFDIVLNHADGILYEDYIEAGGRLRDLRYDVQNEYVSLARN